MSTPPIRIPIQAVDETSGGFQDAQATVQRFASETEAQLNRTGENLQRSFGSVSQAVESAMNGAMPSVRTLGGVVAEIAPIVEASFSPVALAGFGAVVIALADHYMPALTDALYGFGEAQKKAFEESGKAYQGFVDRIEKVQKLQRQAQLEAVKDPAARAQLQLGFDSSDLGQKQGVLAGLRKQLDDFNAETNKSLVAITRLGFSNQEAEAQGTIAARRKEAEALQIAVGNLAEEVKGLEVQAGMTGTRLKFALEDQAAAAARKLQVELTKTSAALNGIENKITAALTPKYELIQQEWGKTISDLRNLAQSGFPQIAAAAKSAIPAAIKAMNAELESDTRKLLSKLDKEFQQFVREHKFSELGGGGPGTGAGNIQDILKATANNTTPQLKQIQSLNRELFGMADIAKITEQSFTRMFNAIALGANQGQGAWKSLEQAAISAIGGIIAKLLEMFVVQRLVGLFGGAFGGGGLSGAVAGLPLNQANPMLFASVPGFASGGDFNANMPMIVGERGPELMVPRHAGTIIPNGMGGVTNNHVNVDARGASDPNAIYAAVAKAMKVTEAKTINSIRQKAARS